MNKSEQFLNAVDKLWKEDIPDRVYKRSIRSLQDYLAVTSAGAAFQKEKISKFFEFSQPENGDFTIIGTDRKTVLKEAVFLNGLNAHALDFDDGTNSGIIHLGSPVFSLLLALSERYGTKTGDLLKAAIIGYETSYTMAVSMQPGHKALGFHATGTCGILGAVIAASYMLGFTDEERADAFSAACVSATGMLKVLDGESELKPYNVAKTSLLALCSLQMAKAGFKGNSDPLGGYRGYLKMMTGNENTEIKPLLLNGTYAIEKSYTKPYASCRYTHPCVEGAIKIKEKYSVLPDDVKSVEIKTYSLAVSGHNHTYIPGVYSAKMSIPYSTAAGLIFGKAGLNEFSEENIQRNDIAELTKKVHVEADEELSKAFPDIQCAIITVDTNNGVYTEKVDFPKGEPENPLTDKEFKDRYLELMKYADIGNNISENLFDFSADMNSEPKDFLKIFSK